MRISLSMTRYAHFNTPTSKIYQNSFETVFLQRATDYIHANLYFICQAPQIHQIGPYHVQNKGNGTELICGRFIKEL